MNAHRKTAISVAVLFLVATATYMTGTGLIESIINSPDYLSQVYPNKNQLILGVLLQFVDVAAIMGIGVLMFPLLKKHSEVVAVSYVATRILESVFLVLGGIGTLFLITLSQQYFQAAASDVLSFQTLGSVFIEQGQLGYHIAMMALGLGSLPFSYILYKSKLIPQWLSGLGFIGYALLLTWVVLELAGFSFGLSLLIPGGLFELMLPIWLFIKGFNQTQKSEVPMVKSRSMRLQTEI